MGEIKKFAEGVMPKSRFIFDEYKVEGSSLESQGSEEDYYSFFGSHEQAILKPESSFKNLHEMMTFLPIDYYILLQKGYKRPKFKGLGMPRTNVVMFDNLPVLHKKATYYKKSPSVVKAITFDDIYRCLEKNDAKAILNDTYAEDELKKLLTKYYGGKINKIEYINYHVGVIVDSFHSISGTVGKDHLDEFQSFIQYEKTQNTNKQDVNEYVR